jgi:hypothetical protein
VELHDGCEARACALALTTPFSGRFRRRTFKSGVANVRYHLGGIDKVVRARKLLMVLLIGGLAMSADRAAAHQAGPFPGVTKDTKVLDRTTVRTTAIVINTSKHARRARCVLAYSGPQGTSVTETVSLRVPPYRRGARATSGRGRVTLRFEQGAIEPVSATVPHCHRP